MKFRTFLFAVSIVLTLFTFDEHFKIYFSTGTLSVTRLVCGFIMGTMLARFNVAESKRVEQRDIITECEKLTEVALLQEALLSLRRWVEHPATSEETKQALYNEIEEYQNKINKLVKN
jgi:hypothetical protein